MAAVIPPTGVEITGRPCAMASVTAIGQTFVVGISVERNYFIRNWHRMRYQTTVTALNLPIGNGAMKSAIRRVVNLGLKGASIYWLEKTAETMLMLRSNCKSGR